MSDLLSRLAAGDRIIADGGIGTLLMERVADATGCPEALNLTHPEVLTDIAAQYVSAGATVITTNTFGASASKLAMYDRASDMERINSAGVAAVRAGIAAENIFVAGSMGPTGRLLVPYGDAEEAELSADFEAQARALISAGADLLLVETMQDLREARLAVMAARAAAGGKPVAATMTFQKTPRGFFTIMGDTVAVAVDTLIGAGADIVGSNCGNGSAVMEEIGRAFRAVTDRPLLLQANAGLPDASGGTVTYDESPEAWAQGAAKLLTFAPCVIGGCCGTTPAHIKRLLAFVP